MHFVAALDRVPGLRCVLGLFEGVVTGAADGYARMAGRPAATLLHCGPGLANGLANLHNAARAATTVVNLVGDQASYHRPLDPLLATDTEALARTVSVWTRTARHAHAVGGDAAEAVRAATAAPGGVATLILPSDTCWSEGGRVAPPRPPAPPTLVPEDAVRGIARLLRSGEPAVLFLAGRALLTPQLRAASAVAASTGARLMAPTFPSRVERGRGRPPVERLPYAVDAALAALAGVRHLVLVGAGDPVAFFAYPGKPGRLHPEDAQTHVLARPDEDVADALARLAAELGSPPVPAPLEGARPHVTDGPVTSHSVATTIAATMPEDAVVVDEGLTFGFAFYAGTAAAPPHDWLQLTGGAIGDGLPMATGAALASPGRRVLSLQADGSALYTVQALWTQARERLDVTTVILSNRRYAILFGELANVGARPGPATNRLFDLSDPTMDWVRLAEGFGVEAARAQTLAELADLLRHANGRPGPFLIELVI
jgi:acetolactate synthase-1/2/3 large subunit